MKTQKNGLVVLTLLTFFSMTTVLAQRGEHGGFNGGYRGGNGGGYGYHHGGGYRCAPQVYYPAPRCYVPTPQVVIAPPPPVVVDPYWNSGYREVRRGGWHHRHRRICF